MSKNVWTLIHYLVLSVFFTACANNSNKQGVYTVLSNDSDSVSYWRFYSVDTRSKKGGIGFYQNGNFSQYVKENEDTAVLLYAPFVKTAWRIIDDSTIMLGEGFNFRVVYCSSDSIVIRDLKESEVYFLAKEANQHLVLMHDTNPYPGM
jgi:hypothetical protein